MIRIEAYFTRALIAVAMALGIDAAIGPIPAGWLLVSGGMIATWLMWKLARSSKSHR